MIDSSELHDDVPTLKATIASMFNVQAKLMVERDELAAELDAVLAAYTTLRCKGSFNVTASDWIAFDAVVRPVVLAADKRAGRPPFDPSPDPEWSAKFEASLSPVDRLRMCCGSAADVLWIGCGCARRRSRIGSADTPTAPQDAN